MSKLGSFGPLVAATVAFVSVFTRQVGVPKAQTMWAEDGYVFLGCHGRRSSALNCLGEVYGGYLHVVPRLGAMLAWVAPPDLWAVAVTTVAAAILAWSAFLVAAAVEVATGSVLAGVVGGVALALPYQAGHEIAGNLANLHWVLFVAAVVIVVAMWLGRPPNGFDVVAVAGMALSSALAPIVVALAGFGALARRPGALRLAAAAAIGSVVQAGVALTVPRDPPLHDPVGLADALRAFVDLVLVAGPFGPAALLPGWVLTAAAVGVVGSLAMARSRRGEALLALAGLVGAALAAYVTAVLVNRWTGPRYEYVPGVLLIEAAVLGATLVTTAVDRTPGRPSRSWLARVPLLAVVGVVAIGAASSYRLESRTSNGPNYEVEFEQAVGACREPGLGLAPDSVQVRISPWPSDRTWTVEVPCDRVARRSR